MQKPVVSIAITAYNKERFVAKTIQSVVDQVTDFPYEVVIGDDYSTDRTRKIIKEFQTKYPDKIRTLIFNEQNEGVSVLFPKVLQNCTGEYIATLDGDDYWTDYTIVDEYDKVIHKDYFKSWGKNIYRLEDILSSLTPPRHTLFFKKEVLPDPFPENYKTARVNDDHYFSALIAEKSDITVLYINTANYLKHTGGIYSEKPYDYKVINLITTNKCMLQHFKKKQHKKIIATTVSGLYSGLTRFYLTRFRFIRFFSSYVNAHLFMLKNKPSAMIRFNYHLVLMLFNKNLRIFNLDW